MHDRVGLDWLAPALGGLLVVLGLLTVAIRSGVIVEARDLLVRELERASLERRERQLQQHLQSQWHEIGPDALVSGSAAAVSGPAAAVNGSARP
jgi:hypothetical protein